MYASVANLSSVVLSQAGKFGRSFNLIPYPFRAAELQQLDALSLREFN
jgi:hypothetical protein